MKLGRFCCRPENKFPTREFLQKPFSTGGFTYATDGHICIRIPETPGAFAYPDAPETFRVAKVFERYPDNPKWQTLLRHNLPEPVLDKCKSCAGAGRSHPCPSCRCECFYCDGAGTVYADPRNTGVQVFESIVSTRYFRLIAELRNVLMFPAAPKDPVPFTFQSGYLDCQGLIMPLNETPATLYRSTWGED